MSAAISGPLSVRSTMSAAVTNWTLAAAIQSDEKNAPADDAYDP
jgi:hypothetical protein